MNCWMHKLLEPGLAGALNLFHEAWKYIRFFRSIFKTEMADDKG